MKLWLDDIRPAPPGWTWIKTAEEALSLLRSGTVEEASLDHDLGMVPVSVDSLTTAQLQRYTENPYAPDGTWLARQMVEHGCIPPVVRVHSQNPVGRRRMEEILGIGRKA